MSFGTGHHETTHMMIQHILAFDFTNKSEEMRYNMNQKVEAISIPEAAKIKDFYIQWY